MSMSVRRPWRQRPDPRPTIAAHGHPAATRGASASLSGLGQWLVVARVALGKQNERDPERAEEGQRRVETGGVLDEPVQHLVPVVPPGGADEERGEDGRPTWVVQWLELRQEDSTLRVLARVQGPRVTSRWIRNPSTFLSSASARTTSPVSRRG